MRALISVALLLGVLISGFSSRAEFRLDNGESLPVGGLTYQEHFDRAIACLETLPALRSKIDTARSAGTLFRYEQEVQDMNAKLIGHWDPLDYRPVNDGVDGTRTPLLTLAHEICHAAQAAETGRLPGLADEPCGTPSGDAESFAVNECENVVRQAKSRTASIGGVFFSCPMGADSALPPSERLQPRTTVQGVPLCCGNGTKDASETCDWSAGDGSGSCQAGEGCSANCGCKSCGEKFSDNGDGTITDRKSRLMWEKKDRSGGLHEVESGYPYPAAIGWLSGVNTEDGAGFAGYNDWRIPTVGRSGDEPELETIFRRSCYAVGPDSVCAFPPPFPDWCPAGECLDPIWTATCTDGCSVESCSCTAVLPCGDDCSAENYWSSTLTADGFTRYTASTELGIVWAGGHPDSEFHVRAVRGPVDVDPLPAGCD